MTPCCSKRAFWRVSLILSLVAVPSGIGAQPRELTALPQVMGVFAPGQGENLTRAEQVQTLPSSFASQIEMYSSLSRDVHRLRDTDLPKYYRTLENRLEATAPASRLELRPGVVIRRDQTHNVPFIEATSRGGALFGMGYARAQDRLWQMDVNRHAWRGELTTLLGPGKDRENIKADSQLFLQIDYTEGDYRKMFERLALQGPTGLRVQADLREYVEGINAFIRAAIKDPALLPIEYKQRGLVPKPWRLTDEFAAIVGGNLGFQSPPGGALRNALLRQHLGQRLGDQADAAYDDIRHGTREDAAPPVIKDRAFADGTARKDTPAALAMPDPGSFKAFDPIIVEGASANDNNPWYQIWKRRLTKSNAVLVSGRYTVSGRPMSVQGPQDGFGTPHSVDSEIAFSAPDFEGHGIFEFGPYPYNGARGRDFAISLTVQSSDTEDVFAERLCEPGGRKPTSASQFYLYRGECLPLTLKTERLQSPDGTLAYHRFSLRSAHGQVIGHATVNGHPVVYAVGRASAGVEERQLIANSLFFTPSAVHSSKSFVAAALRGWWDMGYYYLDRADIAYAMPAVVPYRPLGVSGDLPIWGTGEWDWKGFDAQTGRSAERPDSARPHVINPGPVITGWNNPVASGWKSGDAEYSTLNHRVRLLRDPAERLVAKNLKVTRAAIVALQHKAALQDVNAYSLLPVLLRLLDAHGSKNVERGPSTALQAWLADGVMYEEAAAGGVYRHGAAILLFRTWVELLLHDVLVPTLGINVPYRQGIEVNVRDTPSSLYPSATSVWVDMLVRDLGRWQGDGAVTTQIEYCGKGDRSVCLTTIEDTLARAAAILRQKHGMDLAKWQASIACEACLHLDFPSTGAAKDVPPIAWQNRPVFEMSVAF